MQYTRQLALVLVPVYFIKHSVSCYIYYMVFWAKLAVSPKYESWYHLKGLFLGFQKLNTHIMAAEKSPNHWL